MEVIAIFDPPEKPFVLFQVRDLTHKNSALNRQMMHQATRDKLTDSMQMYQWGVEGGHPEDGKLVYNLNGFIKEPVQFLRLMEKS